MKKKTGFAGKGDAHYRRQAWRFMLSGGALLNNPDFAEAAAVRLLIE